MLRNGATIVGYGSLMSARGIARHGELRLAAAQRVQLHNARRGFGKASIHGDRFAMVLEAIDTSRAITASGLNHCEPGTAPQALAIDVFAGDLPTLAKREGYSPEAFASLLALADAAGHDPGAYLAALMWECGGNVVLYRERLARRVDYTSPHYIPHPIPIGTRPAIIFLAPGREGSGDVDIVPIRVRTGCCDLMNTAQVWQRKPNEAQLEYIAMCLLAEAHGVRVDDLTQDLPADLRDRLDRTDMNVDRERTRLRRLLASDGSS